MAHFLTFFWGNSYTDTGTIANQALAGQHLVSNKCKWNNCFVNNNGLFQKINLASFIL